MELVEYITFLSALLFVLALIWLLYWLVRRLGLATPMLGAGKGRRLGIVEMAALDARRRLILVRRDGVEHLLLVGGTQDVVVERGIPAPAEPAFAEAIRATEEALPPHINRESRP